LTAPVPPGDECGFGQLWHRQALSRALEAARVLERAEHHGAALGDTVGLQALEDLLAVVQHRRGGIHGQRRARRDLGAVPALALGVADHRHVIGEDAPEPRIMQQRGAVIRWRRRRMRLVDEGQAGCGELVHYGLVRGAPELSSGALQCRMELYIPKDA
jgi:hypothetical protein